MTNLSPEEIKDAARSIDKGATMSLGELLAIHPDDRGAGKDAFAIIRKFNEQNPDVSALNLPPSKIVGIIEDRPAKYRWIKLNWS